MKTRIYLQKVFEHILGTRNVYFQPPEDVKMKYPAIRYSLNRINKRNANDQSYKVNKSYQVILIDDDPDSIFIDELLKLPYCSFERSYVSKNLNHFVFTIYL